MKDYINKWILNYVIHIVNGQSKTSEKNRLQARYHKESQMSKEQLYNSITTCSCCETRGQGRRMREKRCLSAISMSRTCYIQTICIIKRYILATDKNLTII